MEPAFEVLTRSPKVRLIQGTNFVIVLFYRKTSNIRGTKAQNKHASRLVFLAFFALSMEARC